MSVSPESWARRFSRVRFRVGLHAEPGTAGRRRGHPHRGQDQADDRTLLNIVNIGINVTNGVVTLAGRVPNPQVRVEAEKEAHSVEGVVRVISNAGQNTRRNDEA